VQFWILSQGGCLFIWAGRWNGPRIIRDLRGRFSCRLLKQFRESITILWGVLVFVNLQGRVPVAAG